MARDHRELAEAIDRFGADLAAWSDQDLANAVRLAALADRGFRARLDSAVALDAGLAALRRAIDAEIVASRAAARVEAVVLAVPRQWNARRWAVVAAAAVLAAALGALADVAILAPAGGEPMEVVILDPLAFGPAATGAP